MFVADDLGLWFVFDGNSLTYGGAPLWYPVSCGLTDGFEHGIACILPSLTDLEHASFENARSLMKTTHKAGYMVVSDTEKSEVKDAEAAVIAQNTAFQLVKGNSRLAVVKPRLRWRLKKQTKTR